MMRNWLSCFASPALPTLLGAGAFAAALAFAPAAHAGALDACGDVFVDPGANCEVMFEGGCKAECQPLAFEGVCAAEGSLECQASCDLDAELACTGSCQTSCEAECEVDPASFDCQASCEGSCAGDCSARCEGADNRGECEASCKATCSAECDASCQIEPGEADCVAQCQSCCSGECRAEINMDCQIGCQGDLYVECKADWQGGCEAQCEAPEGAIFCDGQFIEVGNLDDCVAALRDVLSASVEFEAMGSASASLSCSVDDEPTRGAGALLGLGLLCLASLGVRTRR